MKNRTLYKHRIRWSKQVARVCAFRSRVSWTPRNSSPRPTEPSSTRQDQSPSLHPLPAEILNAAADQPALFLLRAAKALILFGALSKERERPTMGERHGGRSVNVAVWSRRTMVGPWRTRSASYSSMQTSFIVCVSPIFEQYCFVCVYNLDSSWHA